MSAGMERMIMTCKHVNKGVQTECLCSVQDVMSVSSAADNDLPFPIIADDKRELSVKLGMLDPDERDKDGMPLTARCVRNRSSIDHELRLWAKICPAKFVLHVVIFFVQLTFWLFGWEPIKSEQNSSFVPNSYIFPTHQFSHTTKKTCLLYVDLVLSQPTSGLCDWPWQEAEAVHPLPRHHRKELQWVAPSYRLPAAHRAEEGRHTCRLEGTQCDSQWPAGS